MPDWTQVTEWLQPCRICGVQVINRTDLSVTSEDDDSHCALYRTYDVCYGCYTHVPINQQFFLYETCEFCGFVLPANNGDSIYCPRCRARAEAEQWNRCNECNQRVCDIGCDEVCHHCYPHRCDNCGEQIQSRYRGTGFCSTMCEDEATARVREEEEEEEERLLHQYSYRPAFVFQLGPNEKVSTRKSLVYGIELEMEAPRDRDREDDLEACNLPDYFFAKEDGSLHYGVELVSHPGTIEFWRNASLAVLTHFSNLGYRSYNTDSCGMHIHINRFAISESTQLKLLTFFKRNPSFITWVSRRKGENLDRWATIEHANTNRFINKIKYGNDHGDRYVALNFENSHTIECRIFRGTLNHHGLRRNIEFLNALIRFCENTSLLKAGDSKHFFRWLKNESHRTIGKEAKSSLLKWFQSKFDEEEMEECV